MAYKQIQNVILLVILYFITIFSLQNIAFCASTRGRKPASAYTLFEEGTVLYEEQQYEKAIEKFQKAYRIDATKNDLNAAWMDLYYVGLCYQSIQQYAPAFENYHFALETARRVNNSEAEATILNQIAYAYVDRIEYSTAIAYFDSAYQAAKTDGDTTLVSDCLSHKGLVHLTVNEFEQALACFRKSLSIHHDYNTLAYVGAVFHAAGHLDSALYYYETAFEKCRTGDDPYAVVSMFYVLGKLYLNSGEYTTALSFFDTTLMYAKDIKWDAGIANAYEGIAAVHAVSKKFTKALVFYDSAYTIIQIQQDNLRKASILWNVGRTYTELKDYKKARAFYDSSIVLYSAIGNSHVLGFIMSDVGFMYEKTGNNDSALSYYKKAVDIAEAVRGSFKHEALSVSYTESTIQSIYSRLIELFIKLEQYDDAFEYLERSQSQYLKATYENSDIIAYDPDLKRQLQRLNALELQIAYFTGGDAGHTISQDSIRAALENIEGKYEQTLMDVKTYHPEVYDILEPKRLRYDEIQALIPDSTVFIEYTPAKDRYIVFILQRHSFKTAVIENREAIDHLIHEYRTAIQARQHIDHINLYARKLYEYLLGPVEDDIHNTHDIVVIPYGVLHYLPFHALVRADSNNTPEYVLEWKRLCYLPSASFMRNIVQIKKNINSIIAFGNADGTLPGAEQEVISLSSLYSDAMILTNDKATKQAFIDEASHYKIVHLATHGKLDADPRKSHIVLAPAGEGNLTCREIVGLCGLFKGKTSLVTLSACKTAVETDPYKAGRELTTLSDAFKRAGVPSLVATLWQVADKSTAELMEHFYTNLAEERVYKAEALRRAQIDMINSDQYSHPFYWAPFILMGNWK